MYKTLESPFERYRVHSDGFVVGPRGTKLKGKITWDGYREIILSCGEIRRSVRVHILVAESFLGQRRDKIQVNHKDCNKLNNSLNNLEYSTASENIRHAFSNGCYSKPLKSKGSELTKKDFETMLSLSERGKTLKEIRDFFGWSCRSDYIAEILKGRRLSEVSGFSTENRYKKPANTYCTPWGNFSSGREAAEHSNSVYSRPTILKYCRNPDQIISAGTHKGKQARDVGFKLE